ncbi:TRAP transporter substrate-binding protein [Moorella sulfitireducens]|uniref:TRAP transporter substrate-binding protein n=1 Tax=Neomoorella sulfitireducens TaxID=2972948 RepID=UPI0021AC8856|nr:TRAP transporter substrate-binding protein [Moorella sulfitireducens]
MRKLGVILLSIMLVFTVLGCGKSGTSTETKGAETQSTPAQPIKIKVGCDNTSGGPWDQGFKEFMRLVEQKAPGRIQFQYYPDGQLSNNDQRVTMEMLQTGSIHIAALLPSIYEQFDRRWQIYGMPYLFKTTEEARASCDGEAGKYMLSLLEEKGIHGLALWEQGWRHLTTSKKPVRLPPDIKGMKIRVMDSPSFIEMMKELGALPLVTSMGELYTALQQGAADGQENPLTTIYRRKLYEAQDYLTLTRHVYNPLIIGANKKFYDSLPADIQKVLTEAALETVAFERKANDNEDTKFLAELKKELEVIELTDADINQWKEATKNILPKFKDTIGQDVLGKFGIK